MFEFLIAARLADLIVSLPRYQFARDRSDVDWSHATQYCESLSLGGHSDWRLPTKPELKTVVHLDQSRKLPPPSTSFKESDGVVFPYRVEGGITLTGFSWSSTRHGLDEALVEPFYQEASEWSDKLTEASNLRALCVRRYQNR